MIQGPILPRDPDDGLHPIEGVRESRARLEFEQPSQDCLIVVTPRRLALASAMTKVFYLGCIYLALVILLSGAKTLNEGIEKVRLLAEGNLLVLVLLLVPLVAVVPLLSDVRMIIVGRRITFDTMQNVILLNRRLLGTLSDVTQVRIDGERVKGGTRYHLVVAFQDGRTLEFDNSLELAQLRPYAESIARFLKVPIRGPSA